MRPLSLSPHVRSTRLTITDGSPLRRSNSGRIARSNMSRISWGTPGTANITLSTPPTVTGQIRPGAVPRVCGMIVAPSGTCA